VKGIVMKNRWVVATLLGLALSGGCSGAAGPQVRAEETAPADRAQEPAVVRASADLQKKWGIDVGQATRTAVTSAIAIPGVMTLDLERTAQISSLLEGQAVSIDAQVGDEVRKNQVLVTVHAPAMAQAKTAYLQAGARLALAQREFERAEILLKREAIDQREHLRRRTELESASSDLAVAESNLHSYGVGHPESDQLLLAARHVTNGPEFDVLATPYLKLISPIDGHIVQRDVVVGQHVEPQQMLLTLSDLSTLWAVLDAREADLPHVAPGQPVRITTSIYAGRTWTGRVQHVGDVVDEKTRTVKIRVDVHNDGRLLKPNMFVQGEFSDAVSTHDVFTVPEEAIQTIGGESVVFVREAADRFAAHPVEIGERVGPRRAVLHGLDGSEGLVTAGAFNLKAELLKSTLAGE
jgi:membrane fusion protein, heavy metal efflux system